jgi:hypothetical protein
MANSNEPTEKDDVRQAFEEGDPSVAGRDRGRIQDDKSSDAKASDARQPGTSGDNQDWESGRQDAV